MSNKENVLLVEGRSDEAFFSAFCKSIGLSPNVQIAPPRQIGGDANNKEGVLNHLPFLLKQFADGRIRKLAAIVDADSAINHGLGYQATVDRFSKIVSQYGFQLKHPHKKVNGGLLYTSEDGFSDLGLWVMPGTQTDGMLEEWVRDCVAQNDRPLLEKAIRAVGKLETPKFVPLHTIKAEVATWLAWQKSPGRGMESVITENLLDSNHIQYQNLSQWLKSVF